MFFLYLLISFGIVILLGGFIVVVKLWLEWYDDRYLDGKIGGWFAKQDYLFVQLFPPVVNERSMAEMENFYINISSILSGKSQKDIYRDGKWYENFTFEVHSRGGQVGFYIYLNRNFLPLLRSSLAAHYPGATVVETADPLGNFPKEWKGQAGPYTELFLSDITLGKSELFPLKSWKMFQKDDNTPITDPITTLLSNLENIEPEDYVVLQYVLQPRDYDPEKKKELQEELKKLKSDFQSNGSVEVGADNSIQVLTKQERALLDAAEIKLNSVSFLTKIRVGLFSAKPAPQRNLGMIMSFFKQYNTEVQFTKPDADTKTSASADGRVLGPWQDKVYWAAEQKVRRSMGYNALLGRSLNQGSKPKMLDVETITSLFHFPSSILVDQSLASRVTTDYGNVNALPGGATPPTNLPI
jgi:hypothetical protein